VKKAVPSAASVIALLTSLLACPVLARQHVLEQRPDAIIDLMTDEGVRLVKGQWRYRDAQIVEVDHKSPGPDLGPSGPPNRTHDLIPHAGVADFNDSGWLGIEAPGLKRVVRPAGSASTGIAST